MRRRCESAEVTHHQQRDVVELLGITNKDDIWSFDEMDAIDVCIPDAPQPDEIVVSVALAVGGRPFARTRKPA